MRVRALFSQHALNTLFGAAWTGVGITAAQEVHANVQSGIHDFITNPYTVVGYSAFAVLAAATTVCAAYQSGRLVFAPKLNKQ